MYGKSDFGGIRYKRYDFDNGYISERLVTARRIEKAREKTAGDALMTAGQIPPILCRVAGVSMPGECERTQGNY